MRYCLLLLLRILSHAVGVTAVTVPLIRPDILKSRPIASNHPVFNFQSKEAVDGSFQDNLGGGPLVTGCYNIDVFIAGTRFQVMIDSGSSDLLIPGNTLPGYSGPTYSTVGNTPISNKIVGARFADSSSWGGLFYMDRVSVNEGSVSVLSPFAVMMQQSVEPAVTTGEMSQGVLGIAFDHLARATDLDERFKGPYSLLSALVQEKAISQDLVAFRACPADSVSESVVDWGLSDTSLACAVSGNGDATVLWVKVISDNHYEVNVTGVYFGSEMGTLDPSTWQQLDAGSIFDSCTTIMQFPAYLLNQFKAAIRKSGAFDAAFTATNYNEFLNKLYGFAQLPVDYSKLPTLSFTLLAADGHSTVVMEMPPQSYIQKDSAGNLFFVIGSHDENSIVFGATAFNSFYVVLDRANTRVGLAPGCDCASLSALLVFHAVRPEFRL